MKMETVLTALAENPNDRTSPCIVVTVWYSRQGQISYRLCDYSLHIIKSRPAKN